MLSHVAVFGSNTELTGHLMQTLLLLSKLVPLGQLLHCPLTIIGVALGQISHRPN